MHFAGRRRELQEVGRLLERAAGGAGGLLAITGAPGSGKTALAEMAAREAGRRGFGVLRAAPAEHQPGRLVWAQLLRDVKAPEDLVTRLSGAEAGPLDLDAAARYLTSPRPRLIVVDDVDRGGPDAAAMLSVVAARCAACATAVIATTSVPLGLRAELRLAGLSRADLAQAIRIPGRETAHALWMASRGLPGVARPLAAELADLAAGQDPVVHLALRAAPAAAFLDVDQNLIRLLELAAERAGDDATRARVLARLARELLGDASAGTRRRALADDALRLARGVDDPGLLAVVLDARLYALWDPDGAEDRLAAGAEIIGLARAAGDDQRERQGQFWRFVALMELGRVTEAESALAAFAREAAAAGDAEAAVIVTARHAMLAVLRGRLDQATRLTGEVAEASRKAGMADAEVITGTLTGLVLAERGTVADGEAAARTMLAAAVRQPGHLFEATAARILMETGRTAEAAAELDRLLPRALAASGPRWVGALADLSVVAAGTGHAGAAARLAAALAPYRGRLVIWGGANSTWGPVSHYLGLLAAATGQAGDAVRHFEEAIEFEERIGALPYLAHSLHGLAAALTARAGPGDAGRAAQARRRARATAESLGLEAERQALVGELSRAAGLAGRNRLASAEAERARVNVTRTLRAAIERIAPAAPGAAAHLRASVKTGAACRYEPAPGGPGRWHV